MQNFQNNFDKKDILIKTEVFFFCKKHPYESAREE